VLLPPIIAQYVMWARLPQLHARLTAKTTSLAAWISIRVLSILALVGDAHAVAFTLNLNPDVEARARRHPDWLRRAVVRRVGPVPH
jgi:hypothetical protein